MNRANGDIMLIIGTKAHGCSSYLKKRGFVRNIYLAAESQANEVLEFVAMLNTSTWLSRTAELTKT